jgi:hypothetical protein
MNMLLSIPRRRGFIRAILDPRSSIMDEEHLSSAVVVLLRIRRLLLLHLVCR